MTDDDKPVSALPEKFEVFAQNMLAAEDKPKRRRSTPAVKPKDMPEPKKKRPTAADVAGVGGMVEKRWSGLPMWQCPCCNGTTFSEADSKVHKCKQVKYADEEGLDG